METKIGLLKQAMALVKRAIDLEEYEELEVPHKFKTMAGGVNTMFGLVFGTNQVLTYRKDSYKVYQYCGSKSDEYFVVGRPLKDDEKMQVGHWYFGRYLGNIQSNTTVSIMMSKLHTMSNYFLCIGNTCKKIVYEDDISTHAITQNTSAYKFYKIERKF